MYRLATLLAITALAACQTVTPPPGAALEGTDAKTCEATARATNENLLGTPASSIDATASGGRRVIGPNDAVTMDYNAARLNLETDGAGRLRRAYCG